MMIEVSLLGMAHTLYEIWYRTAAFIGFIVIIQLCMV